MRSRLANDKQTILFREETCQFWQERTGESVSVDDAAQAIINVAAVFDLLAKWDQQANESENSEHHSDERGNCSAEENQPPLDDQQSRSAPVRRSGSTASSVATEATTRSGRVLQPTAGFGNGDLA